MCVRSRRDASKHANPRPTMMWCHFVVRNTDVKRTNCIGMSRHACMPLLAKFVAAVPGVLCMLARTAHHTCAKNRTAILVSVAQIQIAMSVMLGHSLFRQAGEYLDEIAGAVADVELPFEDAVPAIL